MIMILKIDADKILINHHYHNNQRSALTSLP